jgi:hypothetical protein
MKLNIYNYNSSLCPMDSTDYNQIVPPLLMPVRHGETCYRMLNWMASSGSSLLTGKDLLRLNHQTVGLVLVITEACSRVFGISSESVMKLRRND